MASAINPFESIKKESVELFNVLRPTRYNLTCVSEGHKKTYADLLERSKQLDPSAQLNLTPTLAKIEKRLALSDRLIAVELSPSPALDPLIEYLIRKVQKIKSKIPGCSEDQTQEFAGKLRELYRKLEQEAHLGLNEETRQQIAFSEDQILSLELQLEDIKPIIYQPPSICRNLLAQCPGAASHLSMIFLEEILENPRSRYLHNFFSEVLGRAIGDAIDKPSISCSEICDDHNLQLIESLKQQFPLTLPEISRHLALCDDKFLRIGIVFSAGKLSVPAAMFNNGMFRILNIAGDEPSVDQPFLITCGTQSQAAESIFKLLSTNPTATFEVTLVDLKPPEKTQDSVETESDGEETVSESSDEEQNESRLIPALQMLIDGFTQGFDPVVDLDCEKLRKPVFHHEKEKGVARDRIYFHLYHIHDKETPQKVNRSDVYHGKHAFHTPGRATSEEKLRAVKRTTLEMLLDQAMLYCEEDEDSDFLRTFELVKSLTQDNRDIPEGMANVADAYFSRLQELSPLTSSTLFVKNPIYFISKEHKLQALNEIVTSLRKAWKLT